MAMESAKTISASAAAVCPAAFVSSVVAFAIVAAFFTRFANVAMTVAFCTCLAAFVCLIVSFLVVFASAAARSQFASRLVLRSRCC